MKVELSPDLEQQLRDLAERQGRTLESLVEEWLSQALAASRPGGDPTVAFHETRTHLETLTREQGIRPLANIEELAADFWPEDESADELLAALASWRHESAAR